MCTLSLFNLSDGSFVNTYVVNFNSSNLESKDTQIELMKRGSNAQIFIRHANISLLSFLEFSTSTFTIE